MKIAAGYIFLSLCINWRQVCFRRDLYQWQFTYVKDSCAFQGIQLQFSALEYRQKTLFFQLQRKNGCHGRIHDNRF